MKLTPGEAHLFSAIGVVLRGPWEMGGEKNVPSTLGTTEPPGCARAMSLQPAITLQPGRPNGNKGRGQRKPQERLKKL